MMKISKLKIFLTFVLVSNLPNFAFAINTEAVSSTMSNGVGMGANALAAKHYFDKCQENKKENWEACAMAAMSVAQGLQQAAAMLESMKSDDASSDGGGSGLTSTQLDRFNADKKGMELIKNDLSKNGYGVVGDSVKTPKGTVPGSAFTSGKAALQAGLGKGSADKIEKSNAALSEVIKKSALNGEMSKYPKVEYGGSGGGYNYVGKGDHQGYNTTATDSKSGKGPTNVSGLTRQYGDQKVGVAADDLFNLVHRQIQQRRMKSDQFLD
jgi:hypothetical protein